MSKDGPRQKPSSALVRITTRFPYGASEGVLWFLAWLAYPKAVEDRERRVLVRSLRAFRIKQYLLLHGNRREIRKMFARGVRTMKNQKIEGVMNKGLGRLSRRLIAGSIAWALYANGLPAWYIEHYAPIWERTP